MKDQANSRTVIFEKIGFLWIPLVLIYFRMGYKISYFEANDRATKQKWFERGVAQDRINKVIWTGQGFEQRYGSHDLALDNLERIYAKRVEKSRAIHRIVSLLKSEMVHSAFKKGLAVTFQAYYDKQMLLNSAAEGSGSSTIVFVPSEFTEMRDWIVDSGGISDLDSRIRIPWWTYIISFVRRWVESVKWLAVLALLPVWELLRFRRITRHKPNLKSYQLGIRIYKNDLSFFYRLRSIDFVLDGDKLNAHNTLFCVEQKISPDYAQKLHDRGYQAVHLPRILREVDWDFVRNTYLKKFVPGCYLLVVLLLSQRSFVTRMTIEMLNTYLTWARFVDIYHVKHFVVYNNLPLAHVIRNILLNQDGTQTWYYEHSCNYIDTFTSPHKTVAKRHVLHSFLYYHNLVCWGNKPIQYYEALPLNVGKIHNIGTLWSEHVRMLSSGEVEPELQNKIDMDAKTRTSKTVAVFDVTSGQELPTQANDAGLFLEGILKLLDDDPEIGIIFKEKNPFEWVIKKTPEIAPLYHKLRSHERCHAAIEMYDVAEVVAASDLMVSACFTSPTIEALGARKKGIFFDATDRFSGCYYDRFPRLVAHNYSELRSMVNYWLYEVTPDQFDEYLDTYVKGELDAQVDGRAISRFRSLLAQ